MERNPAADPPQQQNMYPTDEIDKADSHLSLFDDLTCLNPDSFTLYPAGCTRHFSYPRTMYSFSLRPHVPDLDEGLLDICWPIKTPSFSDEVVEFMTKRFAKKDDNPPEQAPHAEDSDIDMHSSMDGSWLDTDTPSDSESDADDLGPGDIEMPGLDSDTTSSEDSD